MGTRTTQTVGAGEATRALLRALKSGRLSNRALGDMLEILADEEQPEAFNFTVVDTEGPDDAAVWWLAWASEG